ncbi:M48 family metallopeptidase [Halomonas sp. KO116]|uniref:M48 family metallopeptidase n=1 Tax=Halomonas sp. KO116 TaxID=1504981 RepID=UPI0004E2C3DD|nr:M48 family metalloprotease [Halomonas sp. KO116]AJY53289.1 peptidase M48 Ste24p [Halomonas sp. KO116]
MSLGLIRMSAAIGGILIALVTVTMLPIWLVREAWSYLGEWFGWQYPYLWLPDWPLLAPLWQYPPFSLGGQSIPIPPGDLWIMWASLALMTAGILALGILTTSLPLGYRVKAVCGHPGVRLPPQHTYQRYVNGLAQQYMTGPVQVRTVPHASIMAFVMSSPRNRHVIVVSDGLFAQPPAIVQWVIAHEVGHIRFGDTQSTTLWLLAFKSIRLLDAVRLRIMNVILRLLARIPLLRLIVWPVYLVFRALSFIAWLGQSLGSLIFLAADRWVSRRMEFRADRFAVHHEGTAPGLHFFKYLVGSFEPTFDLLATHPNNIQRYEAIIQLMEDADVKETPTNAL